MEYLPTPIHFCVNFGKVKAAEVLLEVRGERLPLLLSVRAPVVGASSYSLPPENLSF